MIIKKVIDFVKRRILRIFEMNYYYKKSLLELQKLEINNNDKTIWFIGSAHYNNIGDLAISEATVDFIVKNKKEYNLIEIRLCDYYKYVRAIKKIIKKDDIIIMQGGGNMGFAYFDAEFNRRAVIRKFKNNKIIIFPSTIDYGNSLREKIELKKSIYIYNKHKDLIICAREEKSYNLMKKIYKNVVLAPDIVLSLGFMNLKNKEDNIIVCLRNDKEKTEFSLNLHNYLNQKDNCIFTDNVAKEDNISIELRKTIFYDKLNEFSKAKLVITDRLHVMIFCTLIEMPCLFIDNTNGKLSGVYGKWIKERCNYIKKINVNEDIEEQILNLSKIKVNHTSDFSKDFEIILKLF